MSLLDLNGDLGRVNGGLGFAVDSAFNMIRIRNVESDSIICQSDTEEVSAYARSTIARARRLRHIPPCEVNFLRILPIHRGFGSFTSIGLALVEGLFTLNKIDYVRDDIVRIARRGGTSGVGINSYFTGKLTVDLGHPCPSKPRQTAFLPSSFAWRRGPALALLNVKMPRWPMLILVPKVKRIEEKEERQFFANVCPLPADEVSRTIRLCFFGILPSVIENNYGQFCRCVRKLREMLWKRSEIGLYDGRVSDIISFAEGVGADAASMSSLGPLVYCFVRRKRISLVRRKILKEFQVGLARIAYPRNQGRDIAFVSR